jgi:tetratricopeptide (TPR) repeat protein
MDGVFIFDRGRIRTELDAFIRRAETLTAPENLAEAIQAWDTVLSVAEHTGILARANYHLGRIYREWDELAAAQRFLERAYELDANDSKIQSALEELNRYVAENRMEVFDERARKNSDLIVSLFRIATGLKLLQMDKPAQAYPLMKSRTKLYPNAAVAKHLLADIIITEDEKNSAIEFLEARGWLENTQQERYALTNSGLYAFYVELAKLHIANNVYNEASACYEQAYWLNDASEELLYHKLICDAKSEQWEVGLALLNWLSDEPPKGVDVSEYNRAVALICGHAYPLTQDRGLGLRAVKACEVVLEADKKDKAIADLLKSLQSDKALQSESPEAKRKRRWGWF